MLFFALPCMLYRFGASTPIAQLLDPGIARIILVSMAVAFFSFAGAVALMT